MKPNEFTGLFKELINAREDHKMLNEDIEKTRNDFDNVTGDFFGNDSVEGNQYIELENKLNKLKKQIYPTEQREKMACLKLLPILEKSPNPKIEVEIESKKYLFWKTSKNGVSNIEYMEVLN